MRVAVAHDLARGTRGARPSLQARFFSLLKIASLQTVESSKPHLVSRVLHCEKIRISSEWTSILQNASFPSSVILFSHLILLSVFFYQARQTLGRSAGPRTPQRPEPRLARPSGPPSTSSAQPARSPTIFSPHSVCCVTFPRRKAEKCWQKLFWGTRTT